MPEVYKIHKPLPLGYASREEGVGKTDTHVKLPVSCARTFSDEDLRSHHPRWGGLLSKVLAFISPSSCK